MQVQYKTEKGTVLFVKVPDDANTFTKIKFEINYIKFYDDNLIYVLIVSEIKENGFRLIGLTSDVTEEQAKMIFNDYHGSYVSQLDKFTWLNTALDSFKSLMQHLKVYEVNPYDNYECDNHWCENGYIDIGYNEKMRCQFCQENEDKQDDAQSRTGKWIVLFKPNEKL